MEIGRDEGANTDDPGKDRRLPAKYIPISLLSHTSEIMDRIILNRIKEEEEELGVIPDEQGGQPAVSISTY